MRPVGLKTQVFLDSGDPDETRKVHHHLGFLDGQTTNPTLIAKNPESAGKDPLGFYHAVVQEIATIIPQGSISIEVYADHTTTEQEMLEQGREMFRWVPNGRIKFPATQEGLKAANQAVKEGMRINMTLVFSQEQAAAVYAATSGARRGDVYVSPFIGRLDDRGENGIEVIANIIKMYQSGDGHVELLTASIRSLDQLFAAIKLGSDIATCPAIILKEWHQQGVSMPPSSFKYERPDLKPIAYRDIPLTKPWDSYNIKHQLTDTGLEKFANDWNKLMGVQS